MTRFDIECNEIVEPRCQIEKIILECNKNCKILFFKNRDISISIYTTKQ
jgi:hypothetical protein